MGDESVLPQRVGREVGAACTMTETKLAANLFSANTYTPLEKGLTMMQKCVFDMRT